MGLCETHERGTEGKGKLNDVVLLTLVNLPQGVTSETVYLYSHPMFLPRAFTRVFHSHMLGLSIA